FAYCEDLVLFRRRFACWLRRAGGNHFFILVGNTCLTIALRAGMMSHKRWSIAAALPLICFSLGAVAFEPGVTGTTIVFGQAAAREGAIAELGRGMRAGLLAAFNEANAKGGVAGRRLELISHNDDYEPEQSIAATRQLIEQEHVFALAGAVGTPTTMAAEPV